MDVAYCSEDDTCYSVEQFSQLPPHELQRKRRFLSCVGQNCLAQAYYRKASTSGQAACFGAYHVDGCDYATQQGISIEPHGGSDLDVLENDGNRIILDLDYGSEDQVPKGPIAPNLPVAGGNGGRFAGGGRAKAMSHRRLSTFLRNLMGSESFRNSKQHVILDDKDAGTVEGFFKNFGKINLNEYHAKYLGYWGFISHAKLDGNGALWLNTGTNADLSILIADEVVKQFCERFNLKDPEEELAGSNVLVLENLWFSSGKKPYIKVKDISCVTIRLAL